VKSSDNREPANHLLKQQKKNTRTRRGERITFFSGSGNSLEDDLKTFFTDENQLLPFLPIYEQICFSWPSISIGIIYISISSMWKRYNTFNYHYHSKNPF